MKKLKLSKLGFFPVGKLLHACSVLGKDPQTIKGVAQFQNHMQNSSKGMLVFFAHLGVTDVFGTAAVLEKYFDYKGVFPIAASWYYFPVFKKIFDILGPQIQHKFYPVYRKEEMGTSLDKMEMLDFSHASHTQKRLANKKYVTEALRVLKEPQSAVVLNPYGGRAPQLRYLRSGVLKLVSEDTPILCSLTKWSWKTLSYEIFFSEFQYCDSKSSPKQLHMTIYKEFLRMSQLAGVSEEELIDAKNPNTKTRRVWNLFARGVKQFVPNYK